MKIDRKSGIPEMGFQVINAAFFTVGSFEKNRDIEKIQNQLLTILGPNNGCKQTAKKEIFEKY